MSCRVSFGNVKVVGFLSQASFFITIATCTCHIIDARSVLHHEDTGIFRLPVEPKKAQSSLVAFGMM